MEEEQTNVNLDDEIESSLSFQDGFKILVKNVLRKFVLFVSFGPGILGLMWAFVKVFKR